jgi:hypothetical protein
MLFSTVLTFLIVPATYIVIALARERLGQREAAARPEPTSPAVIAGS